MSVTRKAPTAAKKRDKPRRQRLAEVLAEREAELAEARRQNARLFDEVQAKTHDLEEALQEALRQQTATSDILRVIASSPNDLQPVLDNIVETACRLCSAYDAVVLLREGDQLRIVAHHGPIPITFALQQISRGWASGRAVIERRTIHIDDIAEHADEYPVAAALASLGVAAGSGKMLWRANLVVPLMREGEAIGVIGLRRTEPVPFSEGQIELLKTFSDQAVIAIENARLFDEVQAKTRDLTEALEHQTATSEVLAAISRSPTEVQPVLDAIARSATELCGATSGGVDRFDGELIHLASHYNWSPEALQAMREIYPAAPSRGFASARSILTRSVVHIPDISKDPEYTATPVIEVGFRSVLAVPMVRDGQPIGAIALVRLEPRPFTDRQITLLQTFAEQAVIAINNVRLFDEVQAKTRDLEESLRQQTATANVLKVISRSAFDLDAVLKTLTESAHSLSGAATATVFLRDGEVLRIRAESGVAPEFLEYLVAHPIPPGRETGTGRVLMTGETVLVPDVLADPDYNYGVGPQLGNYRALLGVPLIRDGKVEGVFGLQGREPGTFTQRQIELVRTFADQAVIAIENVRLFDEVQAKTRDLEESLQQQTATANVLKVISRSAFDLDAVLKTLTVSARSLSGAATAAVFLRDGEALLVRAESGCNPQFLEYLTAHPPRSGRETFTGRVLMTAEAAHIPDVLADPDYAYGAGPRLGNYRSGVGVPLLREGRVDGVFGLMHPEPGAFTPRVIELLKTFADQAVIAIENARLFDEVQAKTRDLEESLQQQTATADVLKVISRSAFDLQAVLHTLVESAAKLCDADKATITREINGVYYRAESYGFSEEFMGQIRNIPVVPERGSISGRAMLEGKAIQVEDVEADPEYWPVNFAKPGELRTGLGIPMMRNGAPIGVLALMRTEVRTFNDKQIELVQTFADQAVIAIENARLFDEVQAKTRDLEESLQQQTATADVLKVISRSAFDLQAVFDALISSAVNLIGAAHGTIYVRDGETFRIRAHFGVSERFADYLVRNPPAPGMGSASGRVMLTGKVVVIPDILEDKDYAHPANELNRTRSMLAVPLLRNDRVEGVLVIAQTEPGAFSSRQIELVKTFADQAVIAIENVRLFDEVQAKTRDLTEALQQQTATADVLKVISRSAFDLNAVLTTLTASARSLSGAAAATVFLREGEVLRMRAESGCRPEFLVYVDANPHRLGRQTVAGRVVITGEAVHIPDVLADSEYDYGEAPQIGNYRAIFGAPLIRNGKAEGAFTLMRPEPGAFTDRQIELLKTFADQAMIAIENARLFEEVQAKTRDLQESLEQQTASAEILRVISSSPTDVQPVFDAIAHSAAVLCEATNGTVFRLRDGLIHLVGYYSLSQAQLVSVQHSFPAPLDRGTASGRAILERGVVHIRDIAADREYSAHSLVKTGLRSVLSVPMLRNGEPIGSINVSRDAVRPFSERQIELLKTFADQAVIAINNVGLFNETREALEQQKATADVLKVISRSAFDLDAVLQTLTHSARSLSGAASADVEMLDGDVLRIRAQSGCDPELVKYIEEHPPKRGTETVAGRVLMTGEAVHIPDVRADTDYDFGEGPRIGNYRALLGAPLIRDGKVDGVFTLMRPEPGAFTPRQIEIVQTFADQAVIAIENARLFDEVQARTRDLTEALQQQTATANVLKVISRSAFDLQAVLTTLAESARDLCGASFVTLSLREGDAMRLRAESGCTPEIIQFMGAHPIRAGRETFTGRVMLSGEAVHLPDVFADPEYDFGEGPRIGNYRALLAVPLLREGRVEGLRGPFGVRQVLGVFALARPDPVPFTERQIEMVRAFADQAVIAIENARLFNEVQSRTKELAASLDDLRKAQDRLIQSEKLASLGQLTAGIAHEIKNPLNFINNYSALSRELVDELADAIKGAAGNEATHGEADELIGAIGGNLDKIVQHGKRADSIVKNMLLHSREGSGERTTTNVNTMVEEALNLAYHGARAEKPGFNVTIAKSLDPNAGAAEVYAQEMSRVLLNLISNGFYATTKRKQNVGDGAYEPTIAASTRDLGPKVEIAIRDNGIGISDEVKAKMFNPFFTTKPAGEGTGLGLSLSHDIVVKQHGGTIEVLTEPDAFTQFTIVLPRGATGA